MNTPLKVLLVEDSEGDAGLIISELHRADFLPNVARVQNQADYLAQLAPALDVILANYNLPGFDAITALTLLGERHLDVPLIILSETSDEECAVETMKQGASDYILKGHLPRIGVAVTNALEKRRMRKHQRLLEEQLWHTQKMEAFSRLTGGVAHDYNNLLTIIGGYNQTLLDELPPDSELREYAEEIGRAARIASSLTHQLLAFSRQQVLNPRMLNLNDLIAGMIETLRRVVGTGIQIDTPLSTELWRVRADPRQLEQVFLNLAINAHDAMPNGGTLTISTTNVSITHDNLDVPAGLAPGDYAQVEFKDTGFGISDQDKLKIFDPFFTTKTMNHGTGLGLATCYGIIMQSHGHIGVESEPGHGAAFKIHLPRV